MGSIKCFTLCMSFVSVSRTLFQMTVIFIKDYNVAADDLLYCSCFDSKALDIWFEFFMVFDYVFFTPQIAFLYIIAYLKSPDDVI
mmetsp:Transcript_526/g.1023  ORF Transcript_526/g.1023 Transcript_526/m.1023 type:complete len:85 (+) Transcript_526:704-958(+)